MPSYLDPIYRVKNHFSTSRNCFRIIDRARYRCRNHKNETGHAGKKMMKDYFFPST